MTTTQRPDRELATFTAGEPVEFAAAGTVTASPAERTITGRLVPWGATGATMAGAFRFARGSITWPEDVSWVKLLVEHDQRHVVGYATKLWEQEDGLWGTFHLPEGAASDQALQEASHGLRDAFSVGTALDAATLERARRDRTAAGVQASGVLRETSLVSVPAFDAARVDSVAASGGSTVILAAWSDARTITTTEGNTMKCTSCGQVHAEGVTSCDPTALASFAAGVASAQAAVQTPPAQPEAQAAGQVQTQPAPPAVQAAQAAPTPPAGYGAATITAEAPTYSFNGQGHSFVRDSFNAWENRDADAADRLRRFSQEMAQGGPALFAFLRAAGETDLASFAVETRTSAPELVQEETYRGDLLVAAVDRGRPMFQRLRNVRLTDATPFRIPQEGEFDGVGDHVEGTAHVAEGTLTLGGGLVTPKAVSGAYRVSRELIDSSNPAIDGIASRAMLRDYRRKSEGKVATALEAVGAATVGVDTVAELRREAIAFSLVDDTPYDFGFAGTGAFTDYAGEEATDGRPLLPTVNPVNTAGRLEAGYQALNLDGRYILPSSRLASTDTFLVKAEDVLVAESQVLTFRFDQPEGPGVIKLALWAYVAAAVLRAEGVRRLTTATA